MRLTILGGGGFRVPLVFGALLADPSCRIDHVALHDVDESRLEVMAAVLDQQARADATAAGIASADPPSVSVHTDLDEALEGAAFVFSAIRVGGVAGRVADERVALGLGLLGQETTGPGGLSFALRTVPVAVRMAERIRAVAPQAWVINFTNPAGLITEAMLGVLPGRVIGICDSPIGLARRIARVTGHARETLELDYAGLNHLGWLHGLRSRGSDVVEEFLADDLAVAATEEGQLFGAEWLRTWGSVPNEYVYYYQFTREAIASIGKKGTRGEYLREQQGAFYAAAVAERPSALALWRQTLGERNATYMRDVRGDGNDRDAEDLESGGYEGVALALMHALSADEPATLILNVPGGAASPCGLPPDAVVEVPCRVDSSGPAPLPVTPLQGYERGLVEQVKAVERHTIEAALTGSVRMAVRAFAEHPLVDSVSTARSLVAGYRAAIPQVDEVFGGHA